MIVSAYMQSVSLNLPIGLTFVLLLGIIRSGHESENDARLSP